MAELLVGSWNINSIRMRIERVTAWLAERKPAVACFQETKTEDTSFPFSEIEAAGYRAIALGQKSYNGVALVSLDQPAPLARGLDRDLEGGDARLLAARVKDVAVYSLYVPNGGDGEGEKYDYKRRWLESLFEHVTTTHQPDDPVLLCGDFNIAADERDVHDVDQWEGSALYNDEMRGMLQRLLAWGFVDTFRLHCADDAIYSWWDYRQLAFPKNMGLRIDYVLATRPLAERCRAASIDRPYRKGKKPSDHAPVLASFDWP
ncbi:MAG: exodeoxyribonuclease III [Myxococcales bacterium]|nr:exodeoxyribonuclease III [Myxococcales bacterium]